MILTTATAIPHTDVARFAWAGLRRFHHVPSMAETLARIHHVSPKQRPNVVKQANQIRHCLMQAREYKDAAGVTTLATRPVLLYYSLMSLALAQVLFKATGDNSLDAARGEHAHHGLLFKIHQLPKGAYELATAAAALIAEPMFIRHRRRGTFELWHRTAREDPIVGKTVEHTATGTITNPATPILVPRDERMSQIPVDGISLLNCFAGTPGMFEWLDGQRVPSEIVRAEAERALYPDGHSETLLTVHPSSDKLIQAIQDSIKVRPSDCERVHVTEYPSAFAMRVRTRPGESAQFSLPPAAVWNNEEIRFLPTKSSLNEFGFLYVGLFILGNYARYYPDKWIVDVETGSPLALAAEEFLAMAEWRMALLTLSELSETCFTPQV